MKLLIPVLVSLSTTLLNANMMVQVTNLSPAPNGAAITFRVPDLLNCTVRLLQTTGAVIDSQPCTRGAVTGDQVVYTFTGLEPLKLYRYDIRSGNASGGGFFQTLAAPTPAILTPASGPLFSYVNGPFHCLPFANYPAPADCTTPGELPIGSFPVPAPGGSYVDPNFGATVKVLGAGPMLRHAYSTPGAMSTSGKYTLLFDQVYTTILDNDTALPVLQRQRIQQNWTSGEQIWDPTQDDILYYLSYYWNGTAAVQTKLMRFQISTGTETLIQDYTQPPFQFSHVYRGGTGDMSKDGWLPLLTNTKQVCLVQVLQGRPFYGQTFCADYSNVGGLGWSIVDFVSITKGPDATTRLHYVIVQGSPANAIFQFDASRGVLSFVMRGPEYPASIPGTRNGNGICEPGETCMAQAHSDTLEDSQGIQYLVRTFQLSSPCSLVLSAVRLSAGKDMLVARSQGGGRVDLATLAMCGPLKWPSVHVSCARKAPMCAVSLESPPASSSVVRDGAPYNNEIWITREAGLEIRRLAMHRSVIRQYYDQPRVTLSDTGSRVVWDSNFGETNQMRVVMAETGMR